MSYNHAHTLACPHCQKEIRVELQGREADNTEVSLVLPRKVSAQTLSYPVRKVEGFAIALQVHAPQGGSWMPLEGLFPPYLGVPRENLVRVDDWRAAFSTQYLAEAQEAHGVDIHVFLPGGDRAPFTLSLHDLREMYRNNES